MRSCVGTAAVRRCSLAGSGRRQSAGASSGSVVATWNFHGSSAGTGSGTPRSARVTLGTVTDTASCTLRCRAAQSIHVALLGCAREGETWPRH